MSEFPPSHLYEIQSIRRFDLRDTSVHRGGKKLDASRKDFYTLRKQRGELVLKAGEELSIDGMPETVLVSECERAYELMTSIVAEARRLFV